MGFDSRSFTEKQFPRIVTEKEIYSGGATFHVLVNGNRDITGLSREQAEQVDEALRHAMGQVVRNVQFHLREIIGNDR